MSDKPHGPMTGANPVSDEDVRSAWETANVMGRGKDWDVLNPDTKAFYARMIDADRAVRAALGPAVPVIPEGWELGAIARPLELVDGIKPYIAILERPRDWKRVEVMRSDWLDALTAAIEAIAAAKEEVPQ